jgi:hypothetical protein
MSRRLRDAAVAIVLAVAVVALLTAARADGRDRSPSFRQEATPAWSAGPLPVGWHEVERPLTGVLLPIQVFASATYPIVLHHRPGECGPPRRVLAEMPAGGVLLQVIEYPPRAPDGHPIRVPRLPRRPHRFSWSDAIWAGYECAGPSFKFTYRQAGHALQAQVWMHPATVDPHLRARALRILDRFRPLSAGSGGAG